MAETMTRGSMIRYGTAREVELSRTAGAGSTVLLAGMQLHTTDPLKEHKVRDKILATPAKTPQGLGMLTSNLLHAKAAMGGGRDVPRVHR